MKLTYRLKHLNSARKKHSEKWFFGSKRANRIKQHLDRLSAEVFNSIASPLPDFETLIQPEKSKLTNQDVCLFVAFCENNKIRDGVADHIEKLVEYEYKVILVGNCPDFNIRPKLPISIEKNLSGLIWRENRGLDFGAWGQAISEHHRVLLEANSLTLTNDSILLTDDAERFEEMQSRIFNSTADLIGLTENKHPKPHLQSYFLHFRNKLVRDERLSRFFNHILHLETKDSVIELYETNLSTTIEKWGFKTDTLYPLPANYNNLTVHNRAGAAIYDSLGLPYVKRNSLR